MKQVIIDNPIINSPFDEPARHFRFTDQGITNEVVSGRRTALISFPSPGPKKKGQATELRHRMDPGPHRREQAGQPNPPPRQHLARGRLRRCHPDHRPPDCILDRSGPATRNSSFARSRLWTPPSTLPRSPENTVTPGSRTTCATPTTRPIPACHGSHSRWPPVLARPSS